MLDVSAVRTFSWRKFLVWYDHRLSHPLRGNLSHSRSFPKHEFLAFLWVPFKTFRQAPLSFKQGCSPEELFHATETGLTTGPMGFLCYMHAT